MNFKLKHIRKILSRLGKNLSLRRDASFVPNIVMCIGIVFVWRGMRNLMDTYFFPTNELLSNILAILIGVFIIYLPDNSFTHLGGVNINENSEKELEKDITEKIAKLLK